MVIVLLDLNGKSLGKFTFENALIIAKKHKNDLIKINNNMFKLGDCNKIKFIKNKNKKNINISIKEYYINFNIEDNDLSHIFSRILYILNKGSIVHLYINNSKYYLKDKNKCLFFNKIKNLIHIKLTNNLTIKLNNSNFYFVIKK